MPNQITTASISAKAKPRDNWAGLQGLVTKGDIISSRYRDARRPVIAGFEVTLLEVSSIDRPPFSASRTAPESPRRDNSGKYRHDLCRMPGHPDQNNPQTQCRRWFPVARFRHTRKKGRAQQRKTKLETLAIFSSRAVPTWTKPALSVNAYPTLQSIV